MRLANFGLALAMIGCGAVVAKPSPSAPKKRAVLSASKPEASQSSAPIASVAPSTEDPFRFRLAWQRQLSPFNKGLALAPSGHLAVLASRRLSLHELRGGEELAHADVCFTFPAAFAFVGPTSGALVCEDTIKLFSLPKLEYRGRKALSDKARIAASGGAWLAIGSASGAVRIYDTADWKLVRELAVASPPTALALAANGSRLAIGLESGLVQVMPLTDAAPMSAAPAQLFSVKRGFPVKAAAFDDSGALLFAAAGPAAVVFDASGAERRIFRVAQNVTAAQWLSEGRIAVIAEGSLMLLDERDGGAHSVPWSGTAPESLVTARDKDVVCAASQDGRVACFSHGALPLVRELPRAREPGAPDAKHMVGRVLGITGRQLQIKAQSGEVPPAVGDEVLVLRYRERKLEDLVRAEWVEAARGKVVESEKDRLVLEVKIGLGPDAGGFSYDTPVQLVWPPADRDTDRPKP
jgi:hypothetical protein